VPAKGWCYAPSGVLVGGTRQPHFARASLKPRKTPENAARTRQGLGAFAECRICPSKKQTSMVKNHIFDH